MGSSPLGRRYRPPVQTRRRHDETQTGQQGGGGNRRNERDRPRHRQGFAARGRPVFVTGRRQAELDAAVEAIGGSATGVRGDMSRPGRSRPAVRRGPAEAGQIDVLFANAGGGSFAPLGRDHRGAFDHTFAINVKGTLFTVQKALPLLRGRRVGHPDRLDRGSTRHAGVQRLRRDQGGGAQLRAQLDPRPQGPRTSGSTRSARGRCETPGLSGTGRPTTPSSRAC